ncbi:MAG: sugar ABC transporter permease [Propionicimonas sp.]
MPILIVAGYSLFDNVIVERNPSFVGLENYLTLFGSPEFWTAVANTAGYTVATVGGHFLLGLGFALLLSHRRLHRLSRALFRAIYILPWVFTASVVAVVWRLILDANGVLNWLLLAAGVIQEAVPWLATPSTAMASVVVISVWAGYPIYLVSVLAGLQGIPAELYEAAMVDGAGPISRFAYVTLPGLRPVLYSMTLLDTLWTTQQFTLIWATTGGGPLNVTEMLSTFTYRFAFGSYQFSLASTSAIIVLVVSLLVSVLYVRSQRADR